MVFIILNNYFLRGKRSHDDRIKEEMSLIRQIKEF